MLFLSLAGEDLRDEIFVGKNWKLLGRGRAVYWKARLKRRAVVGRLRDLAVWRQEC
jgi:hypothetical protein